LEEIFWNDPGWQAWQDPLLLPAQSTRSSPKAHTAHMVHVPEELPPHPSRYELGSGHAVSLQFWQASLL
jgi:hypothetical protein